MKIETILARVSSRRMFAWRTNCATRLLVALMLLALPVAAEAQTNFNYTTNNGTIVITSYTGNDPSLVIPSTINNLQVTSLGDQAFYNCTRLASVAMSDSITAIGSGAFKWCVSLTNVTISSNVTSIGDQAFYNCAKLTSITIPKSVTKIGNSVFSGCASLTNVTLPNGVNTIGNGAFRNCSSLTSVTIPNGATNIGDIAFGQCASLMNITIPKGVIAIGRWAFYSCSNLSTVTIPDSVASIGEAAFYCCVNLTSVAIPNGVSSLRDSTFYCCTSLTNITIPSSVSIIGNQAFYACINLPKIAIPDSVTAIGGWAFYSCIDLTNFTIPASLTSIENATFYSCTKLTSLTIPSSITWIGSYAFCSCSNLSNVFFIGDAPSLGGGNSAFIGDKAMVYYLPGTKGWDVAFGGCRTVRNLVPYIVTTTGGAITINGYVGAGGPVIIPETINGLPVTSIGGQAFYNCTELTSVTIPSSVTNLGNGAFSGCTNLVQVYCRGNAPAVGTSVFSGDDKATIYYLQGATGWGTTVSGCPAAKWTSAPPQINSQPRDVSLVHGTDATFHVKAVTNGTISVSYEWLKDGVPLAETPRISGTRSDTLVISQARVRDAGSYSVAVTMGLSAVLSRNASLILKADAPKLAINTPINNQRVSNSVYATSVSGMASDSLGIDWIRVSVKTNSWTANTADSWTNWQANVGLTPGENWIVVQAQDLDGVSTLVSNKVVLVVSDLINVTAACGAIVRRDLISPDFDGSMLEIGRNYRVTAAPWPGCIFTNWTGGFSAGSVLTNSPTLSFSMRSELTVQANYLDLTRPILSIITPVHNQQWGDASMPINGVAQDNVQVTGVNYRVNSNAWIKALGTESWSAIAGLSVGTNTVDAFAEDAAGNHSVTNTVKVIYNQFLPASGSYYGLFSTSNWLYGTSGFISLNVSDRATYTASIVADGWTGSLSGAFDNNGYSAKTVARSGTNFVTVALTLDLTGDANQISGTVSNAGWVASLHADGPVFSSNNPCPFQGRYTLVIPGAEAGSNRPCGFGYGSVTVDTNGAVILGGCLGDGTPLVQRTQVSRDGNWPFYASLYGGKGSACGWLSFSNIVPTGLAGGDIAWRKLALGAATKYYPAGFALTCSAVGSPYFSPVEPVMRIINMSNGIASFANGNLATPFTKQVMLTMPSNRLVVTNDSKWTFNLAVATGLFTGTVIVPDTKKTITFNGALLQDQSVGYGYFLGSNTSGSISLSPAP